MNQAVAAPQVSVIIPARNEEASLGPCLESLVAQTGVTREIILVDDASTDRTRQIAQSFPQVKIVDAGPLPDAWTGKNNALVSGASHARADWLLFTDADTIHRPGSLKEALSEAQRQRGALLSYSPEQEVHGFWEKAVMPVIFAELASRFRPREVSDPYSGAAAANGQYLMISREAYRAVGGHAAIASDLLEDVALARAVKKSGRKIFFRYGADAVKTRMYRSWPQLRDGWTKNLALLFRQPLQLAGLRILEFVLIVGSLSLATFEGLHNRKAMAVIAAFLAAILYSVFLNRIRKAHFRWDATALALCGLPVFAYLLLRSKRAHQKGSVPWKDRRYPGNHRAVTGSKPALVGSDGVATPSEARPAVDAKHMSLRNDLEEKNRTQTSTTPAA